MNMPVLLARAKGRLPTLSMKKIAGMVTATLMMPVTPEARSADVPLCRPSEEKMTEA
jgi:hypothetical protein